MELAVVGATGTLGQQTLRALEEREFPAQQLTLFASQTGEVEYDGETLEVEAISKEAFVGIQVVVLAVPTGVAKPLAQQAQDAGAWVVDLSGAYRAQPDVPLLLSDKDLAPFEGRIVTLAMPVTQALHAAIAPIKATVGVTGVQVTALFGAAHAGEQGLKAFERQTAALLNAGDVEATVFPHRLGFNLVPQVGGFVQSNTIDELALKVEAARTLGPIPVACTFAWAPFFHGTMLFITAQLERAIEPDAARAALKTGRGVKLLDDTAQGIYPMPMLVTADPAIHLGRVRTEGKTLQLCAALDNAGRTGDAAASLALALGARG